MLKFGGYDPALRVDNAAFTGLKLENKILEEIGQRVWTHIDYRVQAQDLLKIQRKEKFRVIGYDRLGSGEAIKLFPREIPFKEIVSSAPKKLDIITLINQLFQEKKLIIHSEELYKEIMEQERYKSDAGNLLYRHPSGHHDDRFWSLGFACEVARPFITGVPRAACAVARKPRSIEEEIERLIKNV